MKKILLAGPWIGELGWELFCWQGHLRMIAPGYDQVIVLCKKGHEFLYSDFTNHIITFQVPAELSAKMWMCDGINTDQIINEVKEKYTDIFKPCNIGFEWDPVTGKMTSNPDSLYFRQKFIKYVSDSKNENYDIIIHPRNKSQGSDRNWDKHKWQSLVHLLKDKYKIAAIGNQESFELTGVKNYRNIPIADTVSLMNRCRLVAGQSSGPMHLAALSGAKHLVWSDEINRERWETCWNPLKTPCIFYGAKGYEPEVEDIFHQVVKALNEKIILVL